MANEIKLKRGSGSDPSASDLVVGEIAIRTDTGKLFTKKDDNSVAEISGGGIDDGDKGDITVSSSGATFTIDNDVVTFAKMQNITHNSFLARNSSGTGDIQQLSVSDVLTMLNVESGATGDQTKSEIDALGIAASTAATLATARNIGGVSFNGSANIDLPGVNTSGDQDTSGNAATATKLATARTIAGVSFDGSANISLNNNAITNGAGYITATLTNEQVQDIVGAMVSGNTESGISVTYQDSDGTLDFSVTSQTDNNFTTTLKNKLDGIAAGATNVTNNNQLTNGAGYLTSVSTSDIADNAVNLNKLSDLDNGRILARVSSGSGNPEAATAAQIRTLLNVADGATAGGGATGGGSDEVFYENDQTVTTNYTITNGKNAMAAGPITINSGVTVTVGSGETLTIV